jgi:Na+-driven multidrug efflux pump
MKPTLKNTLISALLIAVVGLFIFLPAAHSCLDSNNDTPKQCLQANTQSWFSWLKGQSRSTQFHFVDLLELINQIFPAQK